MTGSTNIYNRQVSSTTASSNMDKNHQSKLRRWSSADNHNSIELIQDDNENKEHLFFKREHTTSDADSGTEEIEQQLDHIFIQTMNDDEDQLSTKSFGVNADEGISECEISEKQLDAEEQSILLIENDLELAKRILDELKKDFCLDTSVAFHAEFARLISVPLSLRYGLRYFLFAEEEFPPELYPNIQFDYLKLDNAKAQFKCPNTFCQHAWTSMRARISFSISQPESGLVVLKVFGQNCQLCGTSANALWYIDEVCRVMKNLAKAIFEQYFPEMMNHVELEIQESTQNNTKQSRHSRHDPTQRKGKMRAPHVKEFCPACQHGLCYN